MRLFRHGLRPGWLLACLALAVLLGTPGEIGKSSSFRVALRSDRISINVRERSATRGRFAYHGGRAARSTRKK